MKARLETLNHQLTLVEKFETLFNSQDVITFKKNYGSQNLENTFLHGMNGQKAGIAFNNFKFQATDARMVNINAAISLLKQIFPTDQKGLTELDNLNSEKRVFHFFNLAITAIISPKSAPSDDVIKIVEGFSMAITILLGSPVREPNLSPSAMMLIYIKNLIAQQKKIIQEEISVVNLEAIAEEEARLNQANISAFRTNALRYTTAVSLFTAGAGLVTLSSLLQFSPHIILQIGSHLPPVALAMLTSLHLTPVILAVLAATGVGMAGAAAYLAYRTYYPAASVVRPANAEPVVGNTPVVATTSLSAKLLTGGLMASGFGLLGFSAATVFSPAFVLFTGLQLPPVALIALAAAGALLISIALYRLIKAPTHPAPHAVNDAAQPTDSCYQRIYNLMPSCCFKFSGKNEEAKQKTTANSFCSISS